MNASTIPSPSFPLPRVLILSAWVLACIGFGIAGAYWEWHLIQKAVQRDNLEFLWGFGVINGVLFTLCWSLVAASERRGRRALRWFLRGKEKWRKLKYRNAMETLTCIVPMAAFATGALLLGGIRALAS